MNIHITLTEDEVIQMLADYLSKKLGRRVDPGAIEELAAQADRETYLRCAVEEENLGECLKP